MVIRRVGPLSCAKIGGALYAIMGLVVGVFFALFAMAIGTSAPTGEHMPAFFGAMFGVGAVIFLPLFYGVLGFVMSLISALIYNVIAGIMGGIEIEIDGGSGSVAS